jgi:hypothetical protein
MQQGYATQTIGDFEFIEQGKGKAIIVLHGLMGGLSNFSGVLDYFSSNGIPSNYSSTSSIRPTPSKNYC